MSLSSALSSAVSGLTSSARRAEITSDNIANALTPGFAKRRIEVASDVLDGRGVGVRFVGVDRITDVAATASRRYMESEFGRAAISHGVSERITVLLGAAGQPGAMANRFAEFEAALVAAASEPGGQSHLDNGVSRAKELANDLNRISRENAELRQYADQQISHKVDRININLQEIKRLNTEMTHRQASFNGTNSLEDTRQKLIDEISEAIPIKVIKRQNGQVALFTTEGATLIDGLVSELEFTPTMMITHDMTLASGALSGLTLNGDPVPIGDGAGVMDGGSLGALFAARDIDVPKFNSQMDALARDLIERFQDPAVDTTLAVGDAGIFTDGGVAFDPLNEVGLAGRIEINDLINPTEGGESWRLRDGLNAAGIGEVGDNTILRNLEAAMQGPQSATAAIGIFGSMSAASFAAEITSQHAFNTSVLEERSAYANGQLSLLKETESGRTGVDTDEELQNLLEIEKAYAANARVVSTIDELLSRLLEI